MENTFINKMYLHKNVNISYLCLPFEPISYKHEQAILGKPYLLLPDF